MNTKRIGLGTICGMLAGVVCVIGNLANIPINSINASFLIIAFWERTILGMLIGCFGIFEFKKGNQMIGALIRGAFLGMALSWHMAFFSNVFSINYFVAGLIFGIVIDVVLTWKFH